MSNTMDDVERLGTPVWLQRLVDEHAAGRIPPAGMVWEEPPDARALVRDESVRGRDHRKSVNERRERALGVPSGGMPRFVREEVVVRLAGCPDRWARVFDGDWHTANNVAQWFRSRLPAHRREVVTRGRGLTTAVYVRLLTMDVFAFSDETPHLDGDNSVE